MSTTDSTRDSGRTMMTLWQRGAEPPLFTPQEIATALSRFREPIDVIQRLNDGAVGVAFGGTPQRRNASTNSIRWIGTLPPLYPEWLGDRSFLAAHGLRFAYVTGEMANGIATTRLVAAAARNGMLGFFGAAGLPLERIEEAIDELERELGPEGRSYGMNLIHTPAEPEMERAVVDLYLRRGVRRVCASAFMSLTESVVRYAVRGLSTEQDGRPVRSNHLFAKISRPEVARQFMSPPPTKMVNKLVERGEVTPREAQIAQYLPVAEDITVEADSGGHTDNRPLGGLFPTILNLRNDLIRQFRYRGSLRVGSAGGIGTPATVASAFALGAAYVTTGTINQATIESGLSPVGKQMLAEAGIADVVMAPSADMFEQGVKVQVLKRGTLFASRAQRLFQVYSTCDSLGDIPPDIRKRLEEETFRASLDDIWRQTASFFRKRDPSLLRRAEQNQKLQMALVFRWYLGLASQWAIQGDPERKMDYQIWCGPAMGAFNTWVKGTFLEEPAKRTVAQLGLNLMEGAAIITRAQQLRSCGASIDEDAFVVRPRRYSV